MTKFRPQVDQLEAREVPASASFALPTGEIGSVLFSKPLSVDPAQSSQTLAIPDLSVTKNGAPYAVQPGATASYANGVLVGVTATATNGADTVNLSLGTVYTGPYSAAIAYDAADTGDAFQFADGTVGTLSYTIPWGSVDSSQASQSLTPTAFNLNIAGQNFALGSGSYTQQPTLVFAYGDFIGVNFVLSPPAGFAYTSISGMPGIINATKAGTGQQFVAAPLPKQEVALDFTNVAMGSDYIVNLTFKDGANKTLASISVTVSKTDSAGDIANKFATAINATGKFSASASGTDLKITALPNGRGWSALTYFPTETNGAPWPYLGPTLVKRTGVSVSGTIQVP